MNRKIIFIILGALALLALMFFLWFWFFGRGTATELPNNGSLGSADNRGNGSAGNNTTGNGQTQIGTSTDTSANTTNSGGGDTTVSTNTTGNTSVFYSTPAGVTWLDGSGGLNGGVTGSNTGGGGNGFNFTQTPINSLNTGTVSGSPRIQTSVAGADGQDISLASSLAVVIGGCVLNYGLEQLVISPGIRAVDTGTNAIGNALGSALSGIPIIGNFFGSTLTTSNVSDSSTHVNTATETISQCLTRTLGRLAVQKITDSTVQWINSGFNGQPAYVQDYNKFFTDVSDQAAGEFIQGSGLAFLCSPFQLQVKIAIAQSYANRRSSSASSCTLSGVVGNIDQFISGDFSQGGWNGFLSFTTVPTNNPYGGFMYAQATLNGKVLASTQNAASSIQDGFISTTEPYDCSVTSTGKKYDCKTRITTPGSAIEASLSTSLKGNLDSLQLGDSIDQILGALSNALITKLLYSGLSNVAQANTSAASQATTQAGTLMNSLQSGVSVAQQYASIKQHTILDIQSTEGTLATLGNCWALATSTSGATQDQITQGNAGFASVVSTLTQLEAQVTQNNAKITVANTSIAKLQGLQTDLLLATTPQDVTAAQTQFHTVQTADNPHVFVAADVTAASQDRQTLQSDLSSINQTATAQLTQCYALGH